MLDLLMPSYEIQLAFIAKSNPTCRRFGAPGEGLGSELFRYKYETTTADHGKVDLNDAPSGVAYQTGAITAYTTYIAAAATCNQSHLIRFVQMWSDIITRAFFTL